MLCQVRRTGCERNRLAKAAESAAAVTYGVRSSSPGEIFSGSVRNQRAGILGVLVLLLFVCPVHLPAQTDNLKFEHIGREQGLVANSVLSILQDYKGFMWFGTEDGLFRYDGYGMTSYKHDPLDSTSLGNNNVFAILEDCRGTLWLGTAGGGLNRFDRTTERFQRYKHEPDNPNSLSADVVSALFEDGGGRLWVGTWNGLNAFDPETGTITQFMHDSGNATSMTPHWIRTICEDSLGAIWVGTDGGVSRLNPQTGKFTHFVEDATKPHRLSSNAVNSIIRDRAGTMWVGSWGGLDRSDFEPERFTNFRVGGKVSSICEDRPGGLWIGTQNHLVYFDRAANRFSRFVHDATNPKSLSSEAIQAIYEDRTGTLWFGTNNGVNRLDRQQYRFKQIVHEPVEENSLNHKTAIALHSGRTDALWIGTAKRNADGLEFGLDKLDPKTGQIARIFPSPGAKDIRRRLRINDIHEDRSGVLWMGTSAGLVRYDPETGQYHRFKHDPNDPHSLSGNFVSRIHEDRTGTLWVAVLKDGPSGIDRFDLQQERFSRIDFLTEIRSGKNQRNGVHSIAEGQSGRLWFATMGDGIFLLNPGSEKSLQFTHEPGNPNSLSHGWVGVVHEDRAGMVWAAPWYGGLNKLDPVTGEVTIYAEKHGLASDYITSIVEDDHGRIWMATHNGLSRFDPSRETFKNFDPTDGLLHTDLGFWNVSSQSRRGELYFGGEHGIDYVHPDSIRENPHIPPVVFTKFIRYNSDEASGQAIVEKGVTEKRRFDLSYKDHTLTFEFAALNYRAPHKNQYAYKLEGFHDEWIDLGNKHEVTLTNLDPGEYTLRVKGSNNDGIWNEEGTSLRITIIPPWWRTRWAYGLYVLLFVAALYGLRHYELRRLQLRNALKIKNVEAEKLQELDRLKSRFFASISHEFRTPLTLILGPVEKWLHGIKQKEMKADFHIVQRNARRLRQLINQLLDLSKLEAGKMRLQATPGNIVELIRMIVMTFESLAKQKGIELQFYAQEEEILAYVEQDKLEKIVTNLLANAFKFTKEDGKAKVAVAVAVERMSEPTTATASGFVEIRISDTGVGIPEDQLDTVFDRFHQVEKRPNHNGTGIGLALTKELVELHYGRIAVESEVGKGTTFIVNLPLGNEHLAAEEIGSETHYEMPLEAPCEPNMLNTRKPVAGDQQEASGSKGPILLIVDDNSDMRAYMRGYLEKYYRIVEAEDGAQGIKQTHKHTPDLVISDVMMPEMDGFGLCEKLKTDARTSHIPVILLTARASGESKVEGLETGADDYLTKPFDAKELLVRVGNLIEQRRRLQERFRRDLLIQPSEVTVTSMDEAFLKKVMAAVEAHIDDPDFDTENLARASGVSRRHLNRKLRALTGQSAREFVRTIRLKRAAQLLQQNAATVTEVVFQVGFNNPGYFAKIFREQFGVAPSEYKSDATVVKTKA